MAHYPVQNSATDWARYFGQDPYSLQSISNSYSIAPPGVNIGTYSPAELARLQALYPDMASYGQPAQNLVTGVKKKGGETTSPVDPANYWKQLATRDAWEQYLGGTQGDERNAKIREAWGTLAKSDPNMLATMPSDFYINPEGVTTQIPDRKKYYRDVTGGASEATWAERHPILNSTLTMASLALPGFAPGLGLSKLGTAGVQAGLSAAKTKAAGGGTKQALLDAGLSLAPTFAGQAASRLGPVAREAVKAGTAGGITALRGGSPTQIATSAGMQLGSDALKQYLGTHLGGGNRFVPSLGGDDDLPWDLRDTSDFDPWEGVGIEDLPGMDYGRWPGSQPDPLENVQFTPQPTFRTTNLPVNQEEEDWPGMPVGQWPGAEEDLPGMDYNQWDPYLPSRELGQFPNLGIVPGQKSSLDEGNSWMKKLMDFLSALDDARKARPGAGSGSDTKFNASDTATAAERLASGGGPVNDWRFDPQAPGRLQFNPLQASDVWRVPIDQAAAARAMSMLQSRRGRSMGSMYGG